MEIRRFILDLKSDGSVKWAEVCGQSSISEKAEGLKQRAMQQANFSTIEPDTAYWNGFADGVEALERLS